jgi:tetratricopeptide (TPR) repeat protein
VSYLQKLYVKWALLCAITSVLLISCAGSGKVVPQTEQTATSKVSAQQEKIPESAQKEYDKAIVAMKSGNIGEAKNILSNLSKAYPDLAGPYVNLGIIHFRADEIDQAEQAFRQALKVNPENAVSLNHLGIINRGKGKFEEARTDYEKALEIDPNYAYAHLNYGILLDLYLGELENALKHYKKFQELAPKKDDEVAKWIVDLERRIKRENN